MTNSDPTVLLFQYGSNMSSARLNAADRLNGAAMDGHIACLPCHGIRFDLFSVNNDCGVTYIAPSDSETMWGVLSKVRKAVPNVELQRYAYKFSFHKVK